MSFDNLIFTPEQAKTFARNLRRAMTASGLPDPGHGRALDLVAVSSGFQNGWNEMAAAAIEKPAAQVTTKEPPIWSKAEILAQTGGDDSDYNIQDYEVLIEAEYVAGVIHSVLLPDGYKVTDIKEYRVSGPYIKFWMTDGSECEKPFPNWDAQPDISGPQSTLMFLSDGYQSIDEGLVIGRDGLVEFLPDEQDEPAGP